MKIEEFGVVFDDFLLWLEDKKGMENASFDLLMKHDNYDKYISEYFVEKSFQLFEENREKINKRTGLKWHYVLK